MTNKPRRMFQQVIDDYARLEPEGGDTWNPLHREVELEHRVELLRRLAAGLRAAAVETESLKILDVGCGNGRSTRMYLELGFDPEQLMGVDVRSGALRTARHMHAGIQFLLDEGDGWPLSEGAVPWVSLCTVFSSVRDAEDRRELADRIRRVVPPGGYLFFWDRTHALDFAGGDVLVPSDWFEGFASVWESPAVVAGYAAHGTTEASDVPTHRATLLRRC